MTAFTIALQNIPLNVILMHHLPFNILIHRCSYLNNIGADKGCLFVMYLSSRISQIDSFRCCQLLSYVRKFLNGSGLLFSSWFVALLRSMAPHFAQYFNLNWAACCAILSISFSTSQKKWCWSRLSSCDMVIDKLSQNDSFRYCHPISLLPSNFVMLISFRHPCTFMGTDLGCLSVIFKIFITDRQF